MLDSRILLVGGTIRLTVPTYASEVLTTPSSITVTAYKNGSATGDSITPTLDHYGTGLSLVSYAPTVVAGDTVTLKISATVSGTTRVTVAEFPVMSTAALIAQAVWDVLTSGLATAGSIGKYLLDRIIGTLAAGTHNPQSGDAYSPAVSAASSASSASSSAATAATQATLAVKLAKAQAVVDTGQTPWQEVLIEQGTGGLGVGTELRRTALKQTDGTGVTSTNHVVGQKVDVS